MMNRFVRRDAVASGGTSNTRLDANLFSGATKNENTQRIICSLEIESIIASEHSSTVRFVNSAAKSGDLLSSVLRRTGSRQETRVSSMGEIIHRSTATFVCQGTILTGNTPE